MVVRQQGFGVGIHPALPPGQGAERQQQRLRKTPRLSKRFSLFPQIQSLPVPARRQTQLEPRQATYW